MSEQITRPAGGQDATGEQMALVAVTINGVPRRAEIPVRRTLCDALRVDFGLTGTHAGCEHGVCGACTVLLDGQPVRSCLMLAATADGHRITTVEGLAAEDGSLSPVQQAFVDCHGLQCGFCTPGFLTTITSFLTDNPDPTREEAREAISGNLCRCTGYHNIVSSVLRAAELTRGEDTGPDHPGRPGEGASRKADDDGRPAGAGGSGGSGAGGNGPEHGGGS